MKFVNFMSMEDGHADQNTTQTIELDEETTVQHIKGSSDSEAQDFGHDAWIDYYKKVRYPDKYENTRKNMTLPCCKLDCSHDAELGAHVKIKTKEHGEEWWIVPCCKNHNSRTNETFKVKKNTIAVRHPKK